MELLPLGFTELENIAVIVIQIHFVQLYTTTYYPKTGTVVLMSLEFVTFNIFTHTQTLMKYQSAACCSMECWILRNKLLGEINWCQNPCISTLLAGQM